MPTSLDQIYAYHEQTKHRPDRYARSLGFMEWASQPCPFRHYQGCERIDLDFRVRPDGLLYDELLAGVSTDVERLGLNAVASLLRDSLALSAWKRAGGQGWPLRVVPSSGNLHPTESYLLLPGLEGLREVPALYHYAPYEHALEHRRDLPSTAWRQLVGDLPEGAFLIGLTSIFWRESWKYGERAFRYCQHDLGHVIAALDLAARLLGWHVRLQSGCSRRLLDRLLAVDDQEGPEAEHGACLLVVHPIDADEVVDPPRARLEALLDGAAVGTPNRLSPYHHDWPIIEQVAAAADADDDRPGAVCPSLPRCCGGRAPVELRSCSARQILHQRRSAMDFDPAVVMERRQAMRLWSRLLPSATPFWQELLPWPCCVSLLIQVHRVEELSSGSYLLLRDPAHEQALRAQFAGAEWEAVDDPELESGRLFLLRAGTDPEAEGEIACEQRKAAASCFTMAMLADFEHMLVDGNCGAYAQMFWECGAIGQIAYLEAEASGYRGCGMGSFLDDGLLAALDGAGRNWQDLYHFAIGLPVAGGHLRTTDPYIHRYSDEDLEAL